MCDLCSGDPYAEVGSVFPHAQAVVLLDLTQPGKELLIDDHPQSGIGYVFPCVLLLGASFPHAQTVGVIFHVVSRAH